MNNEPLSDQLKTRTLISHQQVEKVLVQQLRTMSAPCDYINLLQHFHSYFCALEERIDIYIGDHQLPDYMQRRKSESLANDIISLGGTLPKKSAAASIPEINNHLQAFGALYVMEGSTLGGAIISQMITKHLGIRGEGLSFFESYGDNLAGMWDTFKISLNQQPGNEEDAETIIAAAEDTFRKFKTALVS